MTRLLQIAARVAATRTAESMSFKGIIYSGNDSTNSEGSGVLTVNGLHQSIVFSVVNGQPKYALNGEAVEPGHELYEKLTDFFTSHWPKAGDEAWEPDDLKPDWLSAEVSF